MKEVLLVSLVLKGLFLHLLAPIAGFFLAFRKRKIDHELWPFFALVFIGLVNALWQKEVVSAVRLLQLIGVILLCSSFSNIDFSKVYRFIVWIGLAFFVYDLIAGSTSARLVMGLSLPRFRGLVRDYNFSAVVYLSAFMLSFRLKDYKYSLVSFLLIFFTSSRAALLSLVLFLFLQLFKSFKKGFIVLLLMICSYPLFILYVSKMDHSSIVKINNLSSNRISTQIDVIDIIRDRPFGVGYFRGRDIFKKYPRREGLGYEAYEPHNIFLQILLEFGIVGLLLFCFIVFRLYLHSKNRDLFLSILFMFTFINGLHEIFLYIFLFDSDSLRVTLNSSKLFDRGVI